MRKYDHFIFDFDGTLSDSYPSFFKAARFVADKYGISVSDEEIINCLKWESVVKFFSNPEFDACRDQAKQDFNAFKAELLRSEAAPIEGAEELLKAICQAGGKCYIYSHSGNIVIENCKKWGLDVYLTDYMLNSPNFPRKPAPDALLALVERHGLDISRCVMIGDRDIDVLAGKNAGMDGILLAAEGHYEDLAVAHRVDNLMEIADITLA